MTQDELIDMARKAGLLACVDLQSERTNLYLVALEYFAKLVRQAHEQPADKPCAWTWDTKNMQDGFLDAHFSFSKPLESHPNIINLQPLYTRPQPPRKWVGLTDEEIESLYFDNFSKKQLRWFAFARAIEAKLKEKNT
jgi:hypothetical protein